MRGRVALLLLALPGAALGQGLPSRFDVSGVSAGDGLNVRAAPTTAAPVIGTLAADARGVEVVAKDPTGAWGAVNAGEGAGWVALRFLAEESGVWVPGGLPAGLRCLGTEPFWSLVPEGASARLETPEATTTFAVTALDLGVPGDPRRALLLSGEGASATATITPQACSDGMSDRRFGLETLVVLTEAGSASRLLSGCCTLGSGVAP